jgi:hypothetical protein
MFLPYFIKSLNKTVLEIFMINDNPNYCYVNFYSIVTLSTKDFFKDVYTKKYLILINQNGIKYQQTQII